MRNKLFALLLAGMTVLLAGCSLARPEAEDPQDRFCGFFMTYSESGAGKDFYDNPHLTELGTETLDTGKCGSFSFPRQVLVFDREMERFPGMEGYALFIFRGTRRERLHLYPMRLQHGGRNVPHHRSRPGDPG